MANPRTDIIIIDGLAIAPLEALQKQFGMKRRGICSMLRELKVPVVYIGDKGYVVQAVLAEAFLSCGDLGSAGFMAPGSVAKKRAGDKTRIPLAATTLDPKHLMAPHRARMRSRLDKYRAGSTVKNRNFLQDKVKSQKLDEMEKSSFQKPAAKPPVTSPTGTA